MTSPPATKEDLEAAAHRLRDQLRSDLERALRRQTWRMFGLGLAIAGTTIAILRLTWECPDGPESS